MCPVCRSNDDLTQFLRVHRGKNFVKTHGGDIKKYGTVIQTIGQMECPPTIFVA